MNNNVPGIAYAKQRGAGMNLTSCEFQRLNQLAQTINDSARLARVRVTLLSLGSIYLILTILTSTEPNQSLNTMIALPFLGTGLTLNVSYLLAPGIFCYLHLRALFALFGLAGQLRTFQVAIAEIRPDIREREREELYAWLSVDTFVQTILGWKRHALVADFLTELPIGMVAFMLLLLFDLSFMRYQSPTITAWHHVCMTFDFLIVTIFFYCLPLYECEIGQDTGTATSHRIWSNFKFLLFRDSPTLPRVLVTIVMVSLVLSLWEWAWPLQHKENESVNNLSSYQSESSYTSTLDTFCYEFEWQIFCRRPITNGECLPKPE